MNLLHELEGSMNPTPFLKTMGEGVIFFYAFPRARSPLSEGSSSQEESMKVSPSIVDQALLSLIDDGTISVIEEEEKTGDDNTVTTKAPQASHEEENGALSPRKETLSHLQGVP